MLKPPPSPEAYDTLGDTAGYARPADDFGPQAATGDPIDNLLKLRQMLVEKRRNMAQDAITYPVAYLGRSQDIADLQVLLKALNEAIDHERSIRDSEGYQPRKK